MRATKHSSEPLSDEMEGRLTGYCLLFSFNRFCTTIEDKAILEAFLATEPLNRLATPIRASHNAEWEKGFRYAIQEADGFGKSIIELFNHFLDSSQM